MNLPLKNSKSDNLYYDRKINSTYSTFLKTKFKTETVNLRYSGIRSSNVKTVIKRVDLQYRYYSGEVSRNGFNLSNFIKV